MGTEMSTKPRIVITVGCRNLPLDQDVAVKVVVEVGFEGFAHNKDSMVTELISESNPDFSTTFVVDYVFEEKQILQAKIIYQISNRQEILFGTCAANIGRIIHSGGQMELLIESDHSQGSMKQSATLIVKLKEDSKLKNNVLLKISGFELDKKDLFGKSDPYLLMFKKSEKGKWTRTYRTEIIKNNLNPEWKQFPVCLNKLCDGDMDKEILVRCFDWDGAEGDPEDMDSEFDEIIGENIFTFKQFSQYETKAISVELINHKKQKKKKSYTNSGRLQICADFCVQNFSFLDHILSGIDLNFIVSVDLSVPKSNAEDLIESNRAISMARRSNEYEVAIKAVLEILQEYDNDNQFPAFGFGAQIPPDYKDCHEYPLNGDFQNPFCKGVDEVLRAYRNTLQTVKSCNTAFFTPVIRQVNNLAKDHSDGTHYFVLLILTNGTVEDWVETKRAVIEASTLPISIIVVGIGSGGFNDMKTLDQDFGLLSVGNEKALRDNVQFVPMRKFLRMAADGSKSIRWNKIALAKEVLAELPGQLVAYMDQSNIEPRSSNPSNNQSQNTQKSLKEMQHQKLRRCVTAHVNIRPSTSSERDVRKDKPDTISHPDFFSNRSLRKKSIESPSKTTESNERRNISKRK